MSKLERVEIIHTHVGNWEPCEDDNKVNESIGNKMVCSLNKTISSGLITPSGEVVRRDSKKNTIIMIATMTDKAHERMLKINNK